MSYYTVLSATSTLLLEQHFTMRRCRRRFNGPHRYVLFDQTGHTIDLHENPKNRRMGYSLQEILEWLAAASNPEVATVAHELLHEFEDWHQIKTAS